MNVEYKDANFWADKEGILIFTDIEKKGDVSKAEVVYDGKNAVVLNRNDESFYVLKNIAPRIRKKIADAKSVVVVERDKDGIYSYEVVLRKVDDLGIEDEWEQYATGVYNQLKEKMSPGEFAQFIKESGDFLDKVENS